MQQRWLTLMTLIVVASCQNQACPSMPGESCDPRNANCSKGYHCALAEICTRACEQPSDCWVKVTDGCRSNQVPLMRLPDGGTYVETSEDGFCPETKLLECLEGSCQLPARADAGYDLYGPSEFKGNRDQGPVR